MDLIIQVGLQSFYTAGYLYYPRVRVVDLISKEILTYNFYNLQGNFLSSYMAAYSQKSTYIQFFRLPPVGNFNAPFEAKSANEPITTTPQKLLSTTTRNDIELIQINIKPVNAKVIKKFTNFLCTYSISSVNTLQGLQDGDYVYLLQTPQVNGTYNNSFVSYENNFKIIFAGNISSVFELNSVGGSNTILSSTSLRIIIIDKNSNVTYIKLSSASVGFVSVGDNQNVFVIPGTLVAPISFYAIKRILYVTGYTLQVTAVATTTTPTIQTGYIEDFLYKIDMDTEISTLLISKAGGGSIPGYSFVGSYQDIYLYFVDTNGGNFYQLDVDTGVIVTIADATDPYDSYFNFIDLTPAGYTDQAVMINANYIIFLNPISLAFLQQVTLPTYALTIAPTMILDEKNKKLIIYDSAAAGNNQIIIYDLTTSTFNNIPL